MCTLGKAGARSALSLPGSRGIDREPDSTGAHVYLYDRPAPGSGSGDASRAGRDAGRTRASRPRPGACRGVSCGHDRTRAEPDAVANPDPAVARRGGREAAGASAPRCLNWASGCRRSARRPFRAGHRDCVSRSRPRTRVPTLSDCSTRSRLAALRPAGAAAAHDDERARTARRIARFRTRPRAAARLGLARRHVGPLAR